MPSEKKKDKDKDEATRAKLSLKGSSKLVSEFFEYSINSILYQRGVYPPEDFTPVKKYGLNMLVTSDDQIKSYIKRIMSQLNKWMASNKISKLVVVITSKETGENVERWQFDVDMLPSSSSSKSTKPSTTSSHASSTHPSTATSSENPSGPPPTTNPPPTETQIQLSIQSLFRQITASVTFLPILADACTFNVLVYADADSEVPLEWGDSDARDVVGGERVQLRGFSTGFHSVGTGVVYRVGEGG